MPASAPDAVLREAAAMFTPGFVGRGAALTGWWTWVCDADSDEAMAVLRRIAAALYPVGERPAGGFQYVQGAGEGAAFFAAPREAFTPAEIAAAMTRALAPLGSVPAPGLARKIAGPRHNVMPLVTGPDPGGLERARVSALTARFLGIAARDGGEAFALFDPTSN